MCCILVENATDQIFNLLKEKLNGLSALWYMHFEANFTLFQNYLRSNSIYFKWLKYLQVLLTSNAFGILLVSYILKFDKFPKEMWELFRF